MNSIEIFSGAGGLAKGIELAGINHNAFVEWNRDACATLRLNYPADIVFEGDIRSFSFEKYHDIDIIAGGPPCQPFSLGGKARGNMDERDMFPCAISSIRALMPKAFIFENVKGLLRESFRRYFQYILLQLTFPGITSDGDNWEEHLALLQKEEKNPSRYGLRYKVEYKLVNAADYGVPQKRERVIIVGIRDDLDADWSFPTPTHSEDALLWEKYVTGEYWEKLNINMPDKEKAYAETEKERLIKKYGLFMPDSKPWETVREALADLPEPEDNPANPEHKLRHGAREYTGHTGSEIDMPSKTIKAGDHGVPGGENMVKYPDGTVRYYTVLEAKRIQTFPDDYPIYGSWTEAMRQLGNAVPVRLAYIVAKQLLKTIQPRAPRIASSFGWQEAAQAAVCEPAAEYGNGKE